MLLQNAVGASGSSTDVGELGDSDRSTNGAPLLPSLSISVVIPTKNEARNIGWVLEHMDPMVDEIVIVDGLSTDNTIEVARMVRPDVVVIRHLVPGKGEAVRAGFSSATGDIVVMMDADGSMDPVEIGRFVDAITSGFDFVKGSRFLDGGGTMDMTALRKFGNRVLVTMSNLLLSANHSELCYGFMALRRSRIEELGLSATGFEIETEIVVRAHRLGLATVEVPSFEFPRRHGVSNLSVWRDGWRVLRTLVREVGRASPATVTVRAESLGLLHLDQQTPKQP